MILPTPGCMVFSLFMHECLCIAMDFASSKIASRVYALVRTRQRQRTTSRSRPCGVPAPWVAGVRYLTGSLSTRFRLLAVLTGQG